MNNDTQNGAVMVGVLKGGFGKTTVSLNLADRLGTNHGKTLYIEADHNGHGTEFVGFGNYYDEGTGMYEIIADGLHPTEAVLETPWDFDILPATKGLGKLPNELVSRQFAHVVLKQEVIDPLLESGYDHVIIDSPGERNKVMDNALIASRSVIIPVKSGAGSFSGVKRMINDQIKPVKEEGVDIDILAITPNDLQERLDQDRADRRLLKNLNNSFPEHVPPYARITTDEWEEIDDHNYNGQLPGIRSRDAISDSFEKEQQPLAQYDPSNDQLQYFDYLADTVAEQA